MYIFSRHLSLKIISFINLKKMYETDIKRQGKKIYTCLCVCECMPVSAFVSICVHLCMRVYTSIYVFLHLYMYVS